MDGTTAIVLWHVHRRAPEWSRTCATDNDNDEILTYGSSASLLVARRADVKFCERREGQYTKQSDIQMTTTYESLLHPSRSVQRTGNGT